MKNRKIRAHGHRWADLGMDWNGWPTRKFRCDFCRWTVRIAQHPSLNLRSAVQELTEYPPGGMVCQQQYRRWWQR